MKKGYLYILLVFLIVSVALNVSLYSSRQSIDSQSATVVNTDTHKQTVEFLSLFIDKVLKAENSVSFDDRLILENKVRSLNDKQILDTWQKFVASKSNADAQVNLKDLLSVIVNSLKK